jgi:hypothetical protein
MSASTKIDVKQYVVDKKGHKTGVIIGIREYRRLERLLPLIDTDALIFEERAQEEATPVEECNDILERIQQIKAGR